MMNMPDILIDQIFNVIYRRDSDKHRIPRREDMDEWAGGAEKYVMIVMGGAQLVLIDVAFTIKNGDFLEFNGMCNHPELLVDGFRA